MKSMEKRLLANHNFGLYEILMFDVSKFNRITFSFQLCLNVQLSSKHRGLKGEALYIDSEGSFRPERLVEMAEAYHKKYKKDQEFNPQKYLDKIHYVRCHTPEDLKILILHQLDSFLDSHQAVSVYNVYI